MTTNTYRWLAAGQIAAVCALALIAVIVALGSIPELRSRWFLNEAVERYEAGTEASVAAARVSLDRALASKPNLAPALLLQGRIALERAQREAGDVSTARDAYDRLEQALKEGGLSTAAAENGIGCALLLEAIRPKQKDRNKLLAEAYSRFTNAIQLDPFDGDIRVNAALCQLHLQDANYLTRVAEHLAQVSGRDSTRGSERNSRSLSYDGLVTCYSATASTMAAASAGGQAATRAVGEWFENTEGGLWTPDQMLRRAVREFDKAIELTRGGKWETELRARAAVPKARLLSWVTLEEQENNRYVSDVSDIAWTPEAGFTATDRELLSGAAAIGRVRYGTNTALDWSRHVEGLDLGPDTPRVSFYAGSILFHAAQGGKRQGYQQDAEVQAARNLDKALKAPDLPLDFRFWALCGLATVRDHADDHVSALKRMQEAAEVMGKLPAKVMDKANRALFHQNLGILLCKNGEMTAAMQEFAKASEISESMKEAEKLLAVISGDPVVSNIRAIRLDELLASMPVLSADIHGTGPVAVRREDVTVAIDGNPATFTVGLNGRIYVMPEQVLSQGQHTIEITVAAPAGRPPVKAKDVFDVKYGVFREVPLGGR